MVTQQSVANALEFESDKKFFSQPAPAAAAVVVVSSAAASVSVDEAALARRERQDLELQLAAARRAVAEADEKNAQLSSHVMVLEDLLDQKKEHLEFVESRLEEMGMDPIAVTAFTADGSETRDAMLKQQAAVFDEQLERLRQSLQRRSDLLAESHRSLHQISVALEALETQ